MLDAVKQLGDTLNARAGRGGKAADDAGLDFLPEGYLEGRRRRRTLTIMLVLFVCVIGGLGATFMAKERQLAAAEQRFRHADARCAAAAKPIEQAKHLRQKQKTIADRVELTASLLEKLPRSNVLAELTNALPGGVSLTDLELQAKRVVESRAQTSFEKKAAAKGATPPPPPQPLRFDTMLLVTGIAYTEAQVSDYIQQLSRSTYFASVDLKWVKKGSGNDEAMRSFVIAVDINASAEAMPYKPASGTAITVVPAD